MWNGSHFAFWILKCDFGIFEKFDFIWKDLRIFDTPWFQPYYRNIAKCLSDGRGHVSTPSGVSIMDISAPRPSWSIGHDFGGSRLESWPTLIRATKESPISHAFSSHRSPFSPQKMWISSSIWLTRSLSDGRFERSLMERLQNYVGVPLDLSRRLSKNLRLIYSGVRTLFLNYCNIIWFRP